jgi:hypothetical protein
MFDAGDDLIIDDLPRAAPQLLERPPAVLRYGEHLFIARVDHIGGNMKPVELAKDVVAGALGQVGAARQPRPGVQAFRDRINRSAGDLDGALACPRQGPIGQRHHRGDLNAQDLDARVVGRGVYGDPAAEAGTPGANPTGINVGLALDEVDGGMEVLYPVDWIYLVSDEPDLGRGLTQCVAFRRWPIRWTRAPEPNQVA